MCRICPGISPRAPRGSLKPPSLNSRSLTYSPTGQVNHRLPSSISLQLAFKSFFSGDFVQAFPGANDDPDDVVVMVKQSMSSKQVSQMPQVVLPNGRQDLLAKSPSEILPRNLFPDRLVHEFQKTAHKLREHPYNLFKAAEYIEQLLKTNKAKPNPDNLPTIDMVSNYRRVYIPLPVDAFREWQGFAPGTPKQVVFRHADPEAKRRRLTRKTPGTASASKKAAPPAPGRQDEAPVDEEPKLGCSKCRQSKAGCARCKKKVAAILAARAEAARLETEKAEEAASLAAPEAASDLGAEDDAEAEEVEAAALAAPEASESSSDDSDEEAGESSSDDSDEAAALAAPWAGESSSDDSDEVPWKAMKIGLAKSVPQITSLNSIPFSSHVKRASFDSAAGAMLPKPNAQK